MDAFMEFTLKFFMLTLCGLLWLGALGGIAWLVITGLGVWLDRRDK